MLCPSHQSSVFIFYCIFSLWFSGIKNGFNTTYLSHVETICSSNSGLVAILGIIFTYYYYYYLFLHSHGTETFPLQLDKNWNFFFFWGRDFPYAAQTVDGITGMYYHNQLKTFCYFLSTKIVDYNQENYISGNVQSFCCLCFYSHCIMGKYNLKHVCSSELYNGI